VKKKLADELNARHFEIRGKVETLDIMRYDGVTTEMVRKIQLTTT
jgi:hypothetical protein